jgi:hypothetical protein
VGALALAVHGVPRATQDIDLLVREADLPRILELVATLGFDIPASPMTVRESGLSVQRVTKIQASDTLMLDLLLVHPALVEVWDSRLQVHTPEGPLWVVSREGLIRMKAAAGRLRDLADIEALEEGHAGS